MYDFISLVRASRSIRSFDASRPIGREVLTKLVEAARFAPSSGNLQALKFYICSSGADIVLLRANTKWARLLKDYDGPGNAESPAAYIVICYDESVNTQRSLFAKDVGIAAQTIALEAASLGIGSCMIGSFNAAFVCEGLGLPAHLHPELVVALGFPAQTTVLEDAHGRTDYYRDEFGAYHVPKRTLDELIINYDNY